MSITVPLQPDQDAARWSAHVAAYERVFETLTTGFAAQTFELLGELSRLTLLDVAAGTGGAAIEAAARGAEVTAIDAAPGMVSRITKRAPWIEADVMDGNALEFHDGRFNVGLSCFGIVLFPDPEAGMAELVRVVRPGGRVAIVTWTEPQRYALVTRLLAAIEAARGPASHGGPLPAQLRFIDPTRLQSLLEGAGLRDVRITRLEADLVAPSAAELAASLEFAPGMAAMLGALGPLRDDVLHEFTRRLVADQGNGEIRLGAVAHVGIAVRPRL